jgi:hypothetical protein
MNVLLTITSRKPTRDILHSLLHPFRYYDGQDSEFITRDIVTGQFKKEYDEYLCNFACHHAKWNWLGRFLTKSKSFEPWLVDEGVVIIDENHNWQFGDQSVYYFAVVDELGSVRDVYERCKPDMLGSSGALRSGERVHDAKVLDGSLLDDGGEYFGCARRIGDWRGQVLLDDGRDVLESTWQAWHRRFLVHIDYSGSFEEFRTAIAAGTLTLEGYSKEFYDRMSGEIPSDCRSKEDFSCAAIIVECDAMIKNGEWYERKGNKWEDITSWARLVNETLLSASEDSWVMTLEY